MALLLGRDILCPVKAILGVQQLYNLRTRISYIYLADILFSRSLKLVYLLDRITVQNA